MPTPFDECSGLFWRPLALDESGWLRQLWTAALRMQFQFGLAGYEGSGRAPQVSGRLWLVLEGLGKLWGRFWTALGVSGELWMDSAWDLPGLWATLDGALEAALERIWTALDVFDEFGRGLGSCGRLWTALDCSGRLGEL